MGWVEDAAMRDPLVRSVSVGKGSGGSMGFDPISTGLNVVGSLGGAALGGKAAKEAAKIQAKSAADALAFTREQEQAAQGRYGQSKAQYDQQVADWYAARNALLGRYGVDISLGKGGMPPMGAAPPAQTPGAVPRGSTNMGALSRMMPGLQAKLQGATLGEIATNEPATDWSDWSRYNLGGRNV